MVKLMTGLDDSLAPLIMDAAEKAANAAFSSTHQKERVGAILFSPDTPAETLRAYANIVPYQLAQKFPRDHRLGGASIYLHSEIAAFLNAKHPVEGGYLAVTTPPCPNCAKMIVEAGISHVFVHHQGMHGQFAKERADDIRDMSMEIFRCAGIGVHLVDPQTQTLTTLSDMRASNTPAAPANTHFFPVPTGGISALAEDLSKQFAGEAFAVAKMKRKDGAEHAYCVLASLPPGLTPERYLKAEKAKEGKYRFPIDPLNRLIIHGKRFGLSIQDGHVLCSLHPASRAMVNAVAAGIQRITTLSMTPDHDAQGIDAAQELQQCGVMEIGSKPFPAGDAAP